MPRKLDIPPERVERLCALYRDKARAEIAAADLLVPGADATASRGELVPDVAVVKGLKGPAEAAGGAAVSGADGTAISSALERLGFDPTRVFYTLSSAVGVENPDARASRLRLILEAVDAPVVIALDEVAADDVSRALGVARIRVGALTRVAGRDVLALSGLEDSLADPRDKRRVWAELKSVAPLRAPRTVSA